VLSDTDTDTGGSLINDLRTTDEKSGSGSGSDTDVNDPSAFSTAATSQRLTPGQPSGARRNEGNTVLRPYLNATPIQKAAAKQGLTGAGAGAGVGAGAGRASATSSPPTEDEWRGKTPRKRCSVVTEEESGGGDGGDDQEVRARAMWQEVEHKNERSLMQNIQALSELEKSAVTALVDLLVRKTGLQSA